MPTNLRLLIQPHTPQRLVLIDLDDDTVLVRYPTHGHFQDAHYLRICRSEQTGFVLVKARDRGGEHEFALAEAMIHHFMRTVALTDSIRTALIACQAKHIASNVEELKLA